MEDESIELDTDVPILESDEENDVQQLEIAPITTEEHCALLSSPKGPNQRLSVGPQWSYAIRIEAEGNRHSTYPRQLSKMVLSGLRLLLPDSPIFIDNIYSIYENGISYREDVETCQGMSVINSETLTSYDEALTINNGKAENFKSYWRNHNEYLNDDSALVTSYEAKNESISKSLRRFNQMYQKDRPEDAVIDCVIGFETTIIKDGGKLPYRGTVLLDETEYDSRFIYNFLKNIWSTRNGIVHQDQSLESMNINGVSLSKGEIMTTARCMLAYTIMEYIKLIDDNQGSNITQINQNIIRERIVDRLTNID